MTQEEFLNKINSDLILIGNIKNNSNFMNYYLDTAKLLNSDFETGFKFIKFLIEKFIAHKKSQVNSELINLTRGLDIVSKNVEDISTKQIIEKVNRRLKRIDLNTLLSDYKVDVIFYPFLSRIGIIEENLTPFSENRMDRNSPLIYPIPRIMTSKGWRFSFPPKFLNILTQKNDFSVLIIDDGSCTGATIMQMIDAIAFLSVKSIDVLSIFGRLEDYQNELFSRIKSVKVKNNVIPLNILYGVHFNLPVYNSGDNPMFIELREIEQLEKLFTDSHTKSEDNFEEFIGKLKNDLKNSISPNDFISSNMLFPFISRKLMIQIRDLVGKFDSFRLFSEDIPANGDFNYLIDSDESIITLLAVFNLEIHLYQTVKRMFSKEMINAIRLKIMSLLIVKSFIDNEDRQIFLLKSLFHIDTKQFIKSENLIFLSETMLENNYLPSSYRYVEYLLFVIGLNIRTLNDIIAQKSFYSNMLIFMIEIKEKNQELHNKFRFFFETYRKLRDQIDIKDYMPANIYYRLSEYFTKVINNETSHHNKLLPNHFNDIGKNIIDFKDSLKSGDKKEIKTEKEKFVESLDFLNKRYFEDFVEYRFIKEIMYDLKNHSSLELEFNPDQLFDAIINLEKSLKQRYNESLELEHLRNDIEEYKRLLLLSDSKFLHFITNQKSNILNIWDKCESVFRQDPKYVPIKRLSSLSLDIKVNPYILSLTFDNLISNKIKYAFDTPWEINSIEREDVIEVIIKQYSSFIKDKGDGTGQQSIKSILYNFGTLYKKISDNPYILKILFTK